MIIALNNGNNKFKDQSTIWRWLFLENKNEAHWYKNPYKRNFIIFVIIFGFILWSIVTYFRIRPHRIITIIFFYLFYILFIFVCYIAIDNNKYLPQKYGFSSENLIFKYKREDKRFPWKNISSIEISKIRTDKKLRITIDGKTELISLLTQKDKEKIIDYYQKIKR